MWKAKSATPFKTSTGLFWKTVPPSSLASGISATIATLKNVTDAIHTRCCIGGGGPAGMMLGYLLARAGVDVYVLEKHKDFLRDFRGDTIHPSTLELMHEL